MNLLRAAAGALPFIPRGEKLPDRTVTVEDVPIDQKNVAEYAHVTGLRFGDQVPLTYPFALTFPTMMSLVTGFDFPFAAMGSVHIENHITQYRPILVSDTVSVQVQARFGSTRRSAGITTRSTPTRSAPSFSASPRSSRTGCSQPQRSLRTSRARCRMRCATR
jgi:hypothetical protein